MKKILTVFIGAFLVLGMSACCASPADTQNLRIFSVENSKGAINAKSIEKAFNASGVVVDVNNNMNSIFEKRYGFIHHKAYNLAIFTNKELLTKLMTKYPSIGLITPLSMSIYEDGAKNTINVSTLSLVGMARITKIPVTNPDLIAYAASVDKALHKALPNGKYLEVSHNVQVSTKSLTTDFEMELEVEEDMTIVDAKDAFKEEFEGELGPVGFLIPKSYQLEHEGYDFFDTYSIIRFNAIFPVSKEHPDAGAYAPFSIVMYKKKGEDMMHIAFPSIDNWITDLDITDDKSAKVVRETHGMIQDILTELTE
ncbi:MAG: hypothetical protein ACI9TV_000560 [Sulfurimonas sp.]|jgi:uncharacterized protein (DUF302 family)|uniref:hypothetical protein n=1 Tax=Sulfurimonas sp. TaxID=2022749 RepID=UPI0039E41F4F